MGAPDYQAIFKLGDDLKQDILTLQVMNMFDKWWLEAGLDLKLSSYKVLATQDMIGFIENVQNAETVKSITDKFAGVMSTFDNNLILRYLQANNRGIKFKIAQENFRRSVAGYCLTTFILGVGDRHPSNYMVKRGGKFFHIDFGHILGHFKKKFNINRERSKVVYTKEMVRCIGDENDQEYFFNLCYYGMRVLRNKSQLLLNLMWMMISAEMPDLKTVKNLDYVKERLHLSGNDSEANEMVIFESF